MTDTYKTRYTTPDFSKYCNDNFLQELESSNSVRLFDPNYIKMLAIEQINFNEEIKYILGKLSHLH